MSQAENPYVSPNSTELGTGVFHFEGEVTRDEVISHFRSWFWVSYAMVAVTVYLLLISVRRLTVAELIQTAPYLFGIFAPICLYALAIRPILAVRKYDHLWGWIEGRLDADHFVFKNEHRIEELDTQYVSIHTISKRSLYLGSSWPRLIPARMFDDFEGATRLASQIKTRGQKNAFADDLLHNPVPIELRRRVPASAIASFDGPLMSSDTIGTDVSKASRTLWSRLLLRWLFVAIPGVVLIELGRWQLGTIVIVGAGLWLYLKFKPYLQKAKALTDKRDRVVFQMYGWATDDGITFGTLTGHSQYQWPAFISARFVDDLIQLKFTGAVPGYVILNRRQFESNEAWETTVALVRSNVAAATA